MPDTLIVGLGNPEPKYLETRHNMGFMVVDELVRSHGLAEVSGGKFKCNLWKGRLGNADALFAQPLTYMNLSGECVQPLAAWHRIEPSRILVVHDELDLPPGRMKFKKGGGNAGHNGLKSITQLLGTPDFYRLRVGIGKPLVGDTYNWVLGRLTGSEREVFCEMLPTVLRCVRLFCDEEYTAATRLANGYAPPSSDLPGEEIGQKKS